MNLQLRRDMFRVVRDVPYQIGSVETDTSCVAKTKLLGELLVRIGVQCQVWKAVVAWNAIGVPEPLAQMAARPVFNHYFLKAYIPETNRWVIVDATWDKRFQGALPVNRWDGLNDTELAYPSLQLELIGPVSSFSFRNFDPEDMFTKKLNEWYELLVKKEKKYVG